MMIRKSEYIWQAEVRWRADPPNQWTPLDHARVSVEIAIEETKKLVHTVVAIPHPEP